MSEILRLEPGNDLLKARLAKNAIAVSLSALVVAHDHCDSELESAALRGDSTVALEWQRMKANVGTAIRGQGFVPREEMSLL